jgi:hypothetical protein
MSLLWFLFNLLYFKKNIGKHISRMYMFVCTALVCKWYALWNYIGIASKPERKMDKGYEFSG